MTSLMLIRIFLPHPRFEIVCLLGCNVRNSLDYGLISYPKQLEQGRIPNFITLFSINQCGVSVMFCCNLILGQSLGICRFMPFYWVPRLGFELICQFPFGSQCLLNPFVPLFSLFSTLFWNFSPDYNFTHLP